VGGSCLVSIGSSAGLPALSAILRSATLRRPGADNDHLTSHGSERIDWMKPEWTDSELAEWTLLYSEKAMLAIKTGSTRFEGGVDL
jgi:hypothetical protein